VLSLVASGVPLALTVVLLGCCALPFHGLVHRLLPLCHLAEAVLTAGDRTGDGGHDRPALPASPKQDNQDGPRLAWKRETRPSMIASLVAARLRPLPHGVVVCSQVSAGAFRCEDDVGTRLARLDTLRI
jgi:hypothetical protein